MMQPTKPRDLLYSALCTREAQRRSCATFVGWPSKQTEHCSLPLARFPGRQLEIADGLDFYYFFSRYKLCPGSREYIDYSQR